MPVTVAVAPTGGHATRRFRLDGIDPATALAGGMGRADPSVRRWAGGWARALHTPCGPATIAFAWNAGGDATARAWGEADAVQWSLGAAPSWLGLDDEVSTFRPRHPVVAAVWERHRTHRLGATRTVWPELVPTIVAQRVRFVDAAASWRRLVRRWGAAAPGPAELGLTLPPPPVALATRTYADFHRFGVEGRRAQAAVFAARHAVRLEEAAAMPTAAAVARIEGVRGLGRWTATTVAAAALGDPDLVVVGDFWMPTIVRHALTGDRTWCPDDDVMLELLEPFAGHRGRVVRLLTAAGFMPPRRTHHRDRPAVATI